MLSDFNLEAKSCLCRYYLAYANCAHLYKAMLIFDIQTSSSKFVIRPRKGPKSKNKPVDQENNYLKDSFFTQTHADMFNSLVTSYNTINTKLFQYEFIYNSPVKIVDLILNTTSGEPEPKEILVNSDSNSKGRGRDRPRIQKGALKH